jgi:cytoskeletal protein CcmA (bactofilin family)
MFSNKESTTNKISLNSDASVIGTEMQINGNIKCQGSLVIKGTVKGNIECDEIRLSAEGELKGSIKSKDSEISGKFEGNIFSDTISIGSTAKIKGEINYNKLQADSGAKLEAELKIGLDDSKNNKNIKKPALTKSLKTLKG